MITLVRKKLFVVIFCMIALNTNPREAAAVSSKSTLRIVPSEQSEEAVFRWVTDKCDAEHIPDSPSRAFRSEDGTVFLFASHYNNQPLTAKSIDSIRPDCRASFHGQMESNPKRFNARIWLQTFYTEDGQTVYSLGSSDYHGTWFDKCGNAPKGNPKCWWSAIVSAISRDGGNTFEMQNPPDHVIARAPHRYTSDAGSPAGFFTTSNIIKKDDHYYTLLYTFGYKEQKRGNCLVRTNDLASPRSWRAWDGKAYSVPFVSPRQPVAGRPEAHACRPVAKLPEPVRSLVWHEPSKQYIALFSIPRRIKQAGLNIVRVTFRFATSRNLIQWSDAEDIIAFESPAACKHGLAPVGYPALLDPASKDRNFGTIGDKAYLYFSRFNGVTKECRMTMDRDLVRIPVRIVFEEH